MKNKLLGAILLMSCILLSGCQKAADSNQGTAPLPSAAAGEEMVSSLLTKPVEIICPWAPGGSADTNARTIGQVISEEIGQTVTVSNQTGGGGAVGFTEILERDSDGYTLGIITAELNTLPAQGLVSFSQEDFFPIIRMNTLPACVAVAVDAPYNSLEELISYAKEHPGELRTGNVGEGSIWHICAAKLEEATGIQLSHQSFDGASSATAALAAGELDMVTLETSVVYPYTLTGEVKILAIMSEERLTSFPEFPTCKELGCPVVSGSFQGMVCSMNVPDEIKEEWVRLFNEAYQSEAYQSFCDSYGLEKSYLNSGEFRTFLEEDLESVTDIMKDLRLAN